MSNRFGFGRDPQIYKNGLSVGIAIGGDAAKSENNAHLLVVKRVRLSHNIGLLDLTNWTQFKKGNV